MTVEEMCQNYKAQKKPKKKYNKSEYAELTSKLKPFDLKAGDIILAKDYDRDKEKVKSKYVVNKIYPYIFTATKLAKSHRTVGFCKADYQMGEVRKI
jgi:hypothetical protein